MCDILISVIIPVYNAESFLNECLDSIFSQETDNLELICINDGSTDNSEQVLRTYKKEKHDFILFNKENGGLAAARNSGLRLARGKYIYYLDNDDYLLPGSLNKMIDFIEDKDLDLALFNAELDNGKYYFELRNDVSETCSGQEYYSSFYKKNNFFPPSVIWLYLYKRKFIDSHNLTFVEKNLQDDEPFTFKSYFTAAKTSTLDIPIVYHRVLRTGSMTQTANIKYLIDARIAWRSLYAFLQEHRCDTKEFYTKIFLLYQHIINKLTQSNLLQHRRGFLKNKDFKVMRECSTNAEHYKYYWYYHTNYALFCWYVSGMKFSILKKILNRLVSFIFLIRKRYE